MAGRERGGLVHAGKGSLGDAWPESEFEEMDALCHGPPGEGRIRRFPLAERLAEMTVDGGTKHERKVVVRHVRRLMPCGKQAAFVAADSTSGRRRSPGPCSPAGRRRSSSNA